MKLRTNSAREAMSAVVFQKALDPQVPVGVAPAPPVVPLLSQYLVVAALRLALEITRAVRTQERRTAFFINV
jgi:hypothetical protein